MLQPKPAEYDGKTAAEWFREFSTAPLPGQVVWVPTGPAAKTSGGLKAPVIYRLSNGRLITYSAGGRAAFFPPSGPSQSQERAAGALRKLGTNTAVYLSRRIERSLGQTTQLYLSLYSKLPPSWSRLLPSPPVPEENAIDSVLSSLGPDAAPAVPSLIHSLSRGTPFQRQVYEHTLSRLPFRPADIEPVLQRFIRRGELSNAVTTISVLHVHTPLAARIIASALSVKSSPPAMAEAWTEAAHFGEQATILLPPILVALTNEARTPQMEAFWALRAFGPHAAPALHCVVHCLQDEDAGVRYESARVLEAMETNAFPALDSLRQATNDSSVMVRRCSARILTNLANSVHNQEELGHGPPGPPLLR
jgi:hypothetical protein